MNRNRKSEPRFRIDFPPDLPISARAGEIVSAIQDSQVLILAGETGSGKTTQIPKMCLAAGRGTTGKIACTQPRRVAAISLSQRVAEELGVEWGAEVGCKVRFSDQTSGKTVIKFLTDGMLLAEAQGDPRLSAYDTIVVDEAHERSLNVDFLLGHLRQLRFLRPDLKVIITSATIDTEAFSKAFEGAPVIQVEGRTFPVETLYAPLDALGSDASEGDEEPSRQEALHYVDGAVQETERIVKDAGPGDILVFMPSERDIRETCDLLAGRLKGCEIVPLFGRLSHAEQQRVFAHAGRRKIVVATNVAETSLTIPGIRFVVDTGLARVSRYAPLSRTRRLPIEPVSQSSADQRRGRCGRVAEGVCIRLYSSEDYLARPRFTQPEIQRANLADVILRLKAYGLGDVERFPFINPPSPKAVRAGYALLEELGAFPIEEGSERTLTAVGREIARLPVDPTVGRMVLQAKEEKAVREVLVIASGLSIQDPRERPLEKRTQADAAHRKFAHPDSDFLTLLNIWEAFHDDIERLSQGRLRAFCRSHFLSYTRMREWRDVHTQILEAVGGKSRPVSVFDGTQRDPKALGFGTPAYRAIHRSVLSGLLGNIGHRDEENGGYRMAHDRKTAVFPGSVLHAKPESEKRSAKPKPSKGPRWIMAAEVAETSRLFARTCAKIDPAWAVELGAHVARVSHSEPFWNAEAGRVMVRQRTRLFGLEVDSRAVSFGRIDPEAATDILIREGLVNDTITWPFDFLDHNRRFRESAETLLTRSRSSAYLGIDEAVRRFYASRLKGISSVAEIVDFVRHSEPKGLWMRPGDLGEDSVAEDKEAFPGALPIDNRALPLHYAYRPGSEEDGVTLEVNIRDLGALDQARVDWAVPGNLEAIVEHHLRSLPKDLRRSFVPLAESARKLSQAAAAHAGRASRPETLPEALAACIREDHSISVNPSVFAKPPPGHLRVRVRVVDDAGRELGAGRDIAALKAEIEAQGSQAALRAQTEDPEAWERGRKTWEKPEQEGWGFGDVPERVRIGERAGLPVDAFPGLQKGERGVALRLFKSREEAAAGTRLGLFGLFERQLGHELAWLERDLKTLSELGPLAATLGPIAKLRSDAFQSVREWACARPVDPLTSARFAEVLSQIRSDLKGLPIRLASLMKEILSARQDLLVHPTPFPGLAGDLDALVGPGFLKTTPYPQLSHIQRYLKAMKARAERWSKDKLKDAERAKKIAPYARLAREKGGELFWLVEEFRVSLFAQELGTSVPISAVKLDRFLASGEASSASPAFSNAPSGMASQAGFRTSKVVLKSLEALGRLASKQT